MWKWERIYLAIYHLYIYLSVYPTIHLFIYPTIYLSIYLCIHPSINLTIYLYIYLSIIYSSIHIFIYRRQPYRNPTYGPATYSNMAYFPENIFYIFEKLNYQCKVNIISIKSFYLNGKTKFYEIILALLENFFYTFKNFFQT